MRLGGRNRIKRKAGDLRRTQFITTFGCGAIVDMPQESVIIAGTDYWKNHEDEEYKISEVNLQKLLGIDYFVSPPQKNQFEGENYWIPAFRFPNWMYCPKCKRLAHESKFSFLNNPICGRCNKRLVPSRFVIACENGHLDDFPYEWWGHHGNVCDRPELFIFMSEEKSGLDSIIIYCKNCKQSRSMAGSFGKEALKGYKCTRRRPWLQDYDPSNECDKTARTMQRGATNLHYCINISALSIPPWSDRVQQEISKKWNLLKPIINNANFNNDVLEAMIESWGLPEKCGCSAKEIRGLLEKKIRGEEETGSKSWQELLESEYRAFIKGSDDNKGEFKTKLEEVPDIVSSYIDDVILALRLREVMALRGFRRINPEYDVDDYKTFSMLSRDYKKWLPAVEMRGEGIFVKLNLDKLSEWETRTDVINRYQSLSRQNNFVRVKGTMITPRYILLHTLAHLLIRELILQCGYSSAAIKERVYSTFSEGDKNLDMAGILLYTSSDDSEGSLGGLVREGELDRFDNVIRQMLERSSWCSADPLCIQSKGQGIGALNYAACHSCTLLPETSCEARNCYLDRASLVGTLDNRSIGYFNSYFVGE